MEDRPDYSYFTTWPRTSQGSPTFQRRYLEISVICLLWFRNKYDHINTEYNLASYVMCWHSACLLTSVIYCVSLPDWVPRHTITSPQLGPMEFQWQVAAPARLSLAVIINHPKYLHTVNSGYFLSLSRWLKVRSSYHSQTWSEMLLLWLWWAWQTLWNMTRSRLTNTVLIQYIDMVHHWTHRR